MEYGIIRFHHPSVGILHSCPDLLTVAIIFLLVFPLGSQTAYLDMKFIQRHKSKLNLDAFLLKNELRKFFVQLLLRGSTAVQWLVLMQ